mmetsp:Transcript_49039/g.157748  ORF Transcript_49039/g.157748 Transcript_49039/m.157748 type:complete len:222 (-) Transcript_49039:23-688(-)
MPKLMLHAKIGESSGLVSFAAPKKVPKSLPSFSRMSSSVAEWRGSAYCLKSKVGITKSPRSWQSCRKSAWSWSMSHGSSLMVLAFITFAMMSKSRLCMKWYFGVYTSVLALTPTGRGAYLTALMLNSFHAPSPAVMPWQSLFLAPSIRSPKHWPAPAWPLVSDMTLAPPFPHWAPLAASAPTQIERRTAHPNVQPIAARRVPAMPPGGLASSRRGRPIQRP